jgi:chemotaxis protein CheX
MQAQYINPFLRSLVNTFQTMLGCEARRGSIGLVEQGARHYPISGVIGLSGNAVGVVVINISEEVALRADSTLLMTEFTEVTDDVVDAVGELANVVAGQAKAELEEFNLSVSLPSVIMGVNHEIRFTSGADAISVPYDTDFGPLRLEVGLEIVGAAVGG